MLFLQATSSHLSKARANIPTIVIFLTAGKQDPSANNLNRIKNRLQHPGVFTFVIPVGPNVDVNELRDFGNIQVVKQFTDLVPRVEGIAKSILSSKYKLLNYYCKRNKKF